MGWDPFEEFKKFQRELNKRLESLDKFFFGEYRKPQTEIVQNHKNVTVGIKLPGMTKKDTMLKVTDNMVEVKAEKKIVKVKKTKKKYKREKSYKGFYRAISLPTNVVANKAEAKFKDGILEIKIPKSAKKVMSKIKIK